MKNNTFYTDRSLPIISAILCAFMQISKGWFVSAFCFLPLFAGLSKSKKPHKPLTVYMLVYHAILNAFLLTMYSELGINKALALFLCLLCVILITVYQSAVMLIAVMPVVKIKCREAGIIIFCILYVFGQYLLELVPYIRFPWARIELSLAYNPVFLKTASLFGGSFTALLIFLFNAFLYLAIVYVSKSDILKTAISSALLSVIYFGSLGYAILSYSTSAAENYLLVTAIQGEVEGFDKLAINSEDAVSFYSEYISRVAENRPELILLPETAIPTAISDNIEGELCRYLPKATALIYGTIQSIDNKRYNCLKLAREDTFYRKQFLIPFGEYAPFVIPAKNDLSGGKNDRILIVDGVKLACAICIESIHSRILAPQIDKGAELILISTNDSWFKNSYARELHFRHSILRAVEYSRAVIRSANCGISAIIDNNGNILSADYSKNASAVTERVPLNSDMTLFSKVGNVIMLPPFLYLTGYYIRMLLRKVLPCTDRQV